MSRLLLCVALMSTLALSGCGIMQLNGPFGAGLAGVVADNTYAGSLNASTSHEIEMGRKDIDLKGRVSCTAESFNVLGIFSTGNSGYGALLEAARAKGADGIMNVNIDNQVQSYVFGAYTKVITTLTGMAYSYK